MVSFDLLASSMVSDPKQAQLLLEVGSSPRSLEQARAVLLQNAGNDINIERLNREEPAVLLVRTTPERARRLVIALTEKGFTRLKTIYPVRAGAQETSELPEKSNSQVERDG